MSDAAGMISSEGVHPWRANGALAAARHSSPDHNPLQTYCASASCQRERRRRWQQARRQSDPDYRDNQSRAQDAWAARQPDYWCEYRQTHPQYSERNRRLQQERDSRRRERLLAKMDVSTRETPVPTGIYRLTPVTRDDQYFPIQV